MYRGSTTITMYERKQYLEKDKKLRMVKKKIVLIKLMADFWLYRFGPHFCSSGERWGIYSYFPIRFKQSQVFTIKLHICSSFNQLFDLGLD